MTEPLQGRIERYDPARPSELVGAVRASTTKDVDLAVRAAASAQSAWAALPVSERADAVRAAAERAASAERLEAWAQTLCRELGKPLAEARGEIGFALAALRWFADRAPDVLVDTDVDDELGRLWLRRRPYGVVAAITPWNAPVILSMLKGAPALLAGNAVVVKPSPLAPLAVSALLEALAAELPRDLLTVAHGGAEVGEALVTHPHVHKVAFTGGDAVGRAIGRAAASVLTPTVLELGGNDAAILLPDADLSDADVARLVVASFATAGQVCMAAKRIYVPRGQVAAFVERYVAAAADVLVVGDPMTDGTTVGPVVSAEARDRLLALRADCEARGAMVVDLGRVADAELVSSGWFVRPALVVGLSDDAPLVAEEQFGPLVPVLAYDSVDEVIDRANAGELGLGASVWSADEEAAFTVAARMDAGFVFVNTHNRTGMSLRAPFGGVKRSGWGREYGDEGLLEYVQTVSVHAPAAFRPGADPSDAAPGAYPT